MRVLYNGWPLVEQPDGAPALHLLALLEHLPDGVQAVVALPTEDPVATASWLPAGVEIRRMGDYRGQRGRLEWEQRALPGLLGSLAADVLHTTMDGIPLFGRAPCLSSPAVPPDLGQRPQGFFDRLRIAASAGGQTRLGGVLWPADLPDPDGSGPLFRLPPLVEPISPRAGTGAAGNGGSGLASLDLPETYILGCVPPGKYGLSLMLDAWSWAAGPVGQNYPLLLIGVDGGKDALAHPAAERGEEETVQALPPLPPRVLAHLVAGAAALFHPGPLPAWGSLFRLALAHGIPVVAAQDPLCQALVGPAAYLAPLGDARTLGAGILTVIVNEEVASSLSTAGRQRAGAWRSAEFSAGLLEVYQQVAAVKG